MAGVVRAWACVLHTVLLNTVSDTVQAVVFNLQVIVLVVLCKGFGVGSSKLTPTQCDSDAVGCPSTPSSKNEKQ